jgi:LysM repeat protein
MKLHHKILIFILLAVLVSTTGHAQQAATRSTIIEILDGQRFYIHTVEPGQTLFAIARLYDVPVSEILQSNQGINENIHPGDKIKVPEDFVGQQVQKPKPKPLGMNLRRVVRGETLYSLSKEYNVTIDEILEANDGLPEGMKEGEFIVIPIFDRVLASEVLTPQSDPAAEPVLESPPVTTQAPGQPLQQEKISKNGYFEFQERNNETLYELAIRYRISIDSINALNPGVDEQLSKGQIIKIPIPAVENDYITHTATRRVTVNRLARNYNIDLEKIREINPYMSRQLQPGQTIRIPLPPLRVIDEEDNEFAETEQEIRDITVRELTRKEFCNKLMEKGKYHIALMIPFFLEELNMETETSDQENSSTKEPEFIRPFLFLQFYEGLLLAVDSVKKLGFNAEIHVFDVEDDIAATQNILNDSQLKTMDMIIGPFYNTSFRMVSNFAKTHGIPIVNPLSVRSDIIADNPYVFKVQPSEEDLFFALVDYLNHQHKSSQIFIARHNPFRDEMQLSQLKDVLNKKLETRQYPFTSLYHEIVYTRDSVYTFFHQASATKENVVVIYSDNKMFTFDILRKLNQLRDTFNITVIGIPNWAEKEGFDYRHNNNLNTHIISPEFVDYDRPAVKQFVHRFRETFFTEPESYAFKGYDIGIYFLSALMKFGTHFTDCVSYYEMDALHSGFSFKSSDGNGFENSRLKVLRMRNFKYSEVSNKLPVYIFQEQY